MRLPGFKAFRQSIRWLRSRLSAGALILGYHRVAVTDADPYQLRVSPPHFAEQLEAIRELAHPLPLTELVQGLSRGRLPARSVAVTFDDGYSDALHVALPLLERFEIPATVFVTSGYLGRPFWWDELAHLTRPPSAIRGSQPQLQLHELYGQLATLSPTERTAVMSDLFGAVACLADKPDVGRCLSVGELVQLDRSVLVDVGAHSVTHPRLAALPLWEQRREIGQCKAELEAILQHHVISFSYPHGSYSAATKALVRDAGFQSACSSQADMALLQSDEYALPRLWVPDCGSHTFRTWLTRWLPA